MSKVKINPEKLRVADDMRSSEEQGTLVYAKKGTENTADAARNEAEAVEGQDAAEE